ncbi:MAG: HAD family hydrolase [Clostridia bacterium]|nr:HAD family hydrolase [Clostridia bacterium]
MDFIFDLYGTLADVCTDETPDAFWDAASKEASALGAPYTGEAFRTAYLALCADEVQKRAEEMPEVPIEFVEPELLNVFIRLLRDRGAEPENAAVLARRFRERSTLWIRPMPHAIETLDELKKRGDRTFLLSNAQSCFTVWELESVGIAKKFDGILLSSDAGMKKPYIGLFELLLSRYGIDRENAVMVGNDAIADIGGASAAGLLSRYVHTWSSGDRPKTLPDTCREIGDLSELPGSCRAIKRGC